MPEQRVERPNLEAIVSEAGSTFKAGVQTAQYALQLERDNASLTAEVGRLRKVVEEIATDDITLSERHGSGTSQMGSLRKHIACAALTPPAEQPRQKRECPGRGGSCDWAVDLDDPDGTERCCACGRKRSEPVPTDEEFAQRFNLSAKERVLRGLPADQPAPATCPECNGPADQGFSRDVPPQPYSCSKCDPHQPAPATKPCPSCKKSARWPGILLLEGREEACPKCNGTGRVPAPEDER